MFLKPSAQAELKESLRIDKLEELKTIAQDIKKDAAQRQCKYDCIIGASGGFDSTYVIYLTKTILNLNPLVVKYDNGLCHEMANQNLERACKTLGVEYRNVSVIDEERKYLLNATKALTSLHVYFTACFSCHYIIASTVYREARKENIKYMIVSTNSIERGLADASHGFMLKSLIKGFFRCGLRRMLRFMYYELAAQYHFAKLKFMFDGLSIRFVRNLFKLHPATPAFVKKVDISNYVAWDWTVIEPILREKLRWETPRKMPVPYFRFDCHYSAMIDRSFKRVTGMTEHALLLNWFVQNGFATKEQLQKDFDYMNNDERINKEIGIVCQELDLSENDI
jgi:hypothetical protein